MHERPDSLLQMGSVRTETHASSAASPFKPIRALLRYLPRHRRDAYLTMFFGVLGFMLSFAYPWIIGSTVDLVGSHGSAQPSSHAAKDRLLWLAELAAITAVLHALVVYGRGHCNIRLGEAIVSDLRRDLYAHLQHLSVRFYARERTGAILARVLHDVQDATSLLYMGVLVAAMDAAQLLIALALLAQLTTKLTLACALVFPLYAIAFLLMNPRVRRASEQVRKNLGTISGNMTERLAGQAVIKTCTAEEREAQSFSREVRRHFALAVDQSHQGHLVSAVGELLVHVGTTIVVGYGGYLALDGELTPGQLTRFLGYVVILYGPVRRFAELNITYQVSLSAIRRVFRVFDIRPAITERPRARREPPMAGAVSFEHVCFRYADGSDEARARLEEEPMDTAEHAGERQRTSIVPGEWILHDVSLHATPGERIAVIGPSGSGKSTLLSLLPRLYDPTQGRVLVDGVDTRDYTLSALRSVIAIVQQDSFVFTGSIFDNLAYGRPEASEAEIIAAARAAHAHEFIMRMPDGYRTRLGERGVNLSGGQRQRLSIARALVRDPRILILDEATSSLDTDSESIVQEALERLMAGRTCFIIAHRLSTIRHCDRIAVLADGRVAELGSHRELLKRGGIYARMVLKQSHRIEPSLASPGSRTENESILRELPLS